MQEAAIHLRKELGFVHGLGVRSYDASARTISILGEIFCNQMPRIRASFLYKVFIFNKLLGIRHHGFFAGKFVAPSERPTRIEFKGQNPTLLSGCEWLARDHAGDQVSKPVAASGRRCPSRSATKRPDAPRSARRLWSGPRTGPPSVDQPQLRRPSSPLSGEALRRRDLEAIDCTTRRLP